MLLFWFCVSCTAQPAQGTKERNQAETDTNQLIVGAARTASYLPDLKGKHIGVVANQTSMVKGQHLVDMLLDSGVGSVKVFAPEHGFRGEAGPGDHVNSGVDAKTGARIISLYGSHKKPTSDDLKGLDIVVFDIQDVGARFYTYLSTLHYVLEACGENGVPVMVLDRPNPNGSYIDGPVLDTAFRSFVGMDPVPVVHGLTAGEYAKMAVGEGWLAGGVRCELKVVPVAGYTHKTKYELPVRPSPNLPNMNSIYLYPSLCFFEGTPVSVGRGTDYPFQLIGYPGYTEGDYKFTPREIRGVIKDPPHEDKECAGKLLKATEAPSEINLKWLIDMYQSYPDKAVFFTPFFDKLAGTDQLRKQIAAGVGEKEIRAGWKAGLQRFKEKRKKYLIYPD